MVARPIYRWKSFWSGILVAGLLTWAWIVSEMTPTVAAWFPVGRVGIVAYNTRGSLGLSRLHAMPRGIRPGFDVWNEVLAFRPQRLSTPALRWERNVQGMGVSGDHWFFLLLFLITWSALIARRYLRQREPLKLP